MKTCPQNHLITPWLLGDLPPDAAAALEEHLASCPACRAEADALAPLLQNLQAALADEADIPAALDPARLAALETLLTGEPGTTVRPSQRTRRYWLPSLAALAATLALVLILVPDARDFLSRRPTPEPVVAKSDAAPDATASGSEIAPAVAADMIFVAGETVADEPMVAADRLAERKNAAPAEPLASDMTFGGRAAAGVPPPQMGAPLVAAAPRAPAAAGRQSAFLSESTSEAVAEKSEESIGFARRAMPPAAAVAEPESASALPVSRHRDAQRSEAPARKERFSGAAAFISSFNYGDAAATVGANLRLHLEAGPAPLAAGRLLVRIGLPVPAAASLPPQAPLVAESPLYHLAADWNPALVAGIRACGSAAPATASAQLPTAVTAGAIYEIELVRPLTELQQDMTEASLLTVVAGDEVLQSLKIADIASDLTTASPSLRLTALVAALADQRWQSPDSATVTAEALEQLLEQALPGMPSGPANSQLPALVKAAAGVQAPQQD